MYLQEISASTTSSPWLDPRFLLTAIGTLVVLVLWFARLEFKTNANTTRQKEIEDAMDHEMSEAKTEREKVRTAFYKHVGDTSIHHNAEAFREFRERIDDRFKGMDSKLGEIKDLIIARNGK